ncbi:unnamed protein product [Rotaria sp. Silwood2]|nr:unnamed protein product [Rotaria sp. Silwood2]CAF2680316.1 unnamed protein product [Rotaria sp. Silwood2]CAF3244141.1 unnamed protein product [Rotaria sp. Silwood2]CAF4197989.1 unnamed protein product [Rotaria sp. Silwood2]CAF4247559.1 unnamed protein product [Rotaria sp. Silwood2]
MFDLYNYNCVIEFDKTSDKLRRNALNSVQYAEFCLSSCNYGSNDLVRIVEHVSIFENDLSQLIQQLKRFAFLDISGRIGRQKIEPYRSMVQKRFPNSQFDITIIRFPLWFCSFTYSIQQT